MVQVRPINAKHSLNITVLIKKIYLHFIMKQLLFSFFILLASLQVIAQDMEVFNQYNHELNTQNRNGMIALGSWGVGNIIVGTAGALTTEPGSMMFNFHLMNASWNIVNVAIAVPAYLGARKRLSKSYDIPGSFKLQRQQETLYAINMAADVLYIGSGVFLQEFGNRYEPKVNDAFKGLGYSLILQGGFLLVFDAVMFGMHKRHWTKNERKIFEQLEFSGTSIKWNIPSK